MATSIFRTPRDDAPPEVQAERARKATIAARVVSDDACRETVRYAQTRRAETVAVIAEETKRGGRSFG